MSGLPRVCFLLPAVLGAQTFHTYLGRVDAESVLLAWGATARGGGNSIGRDSVSHGTATVRIGGRTIIESQRNWTVAGGLDPDRTYPYQVRIGNREIGSGEVRSWPKTAGRLAFLVIGDYGTGRGPQYEVAGAMLRVLRERQGGDNPVRFVITTGDNIYASRIWFGLRAFSGDWDSHWGSKFFRPYEGLLRSVPFYPALGNHDGDASESHGDLAAYLDNFFFPAPRPSRYYSFNFGGLAELFALDSTDNSSPERRVIYAPEGRQFQWLRRALADSKAPWKIAYFHNPPFNAGPGHGADLEKLRTFVDLFGQAGVKVVFNGHEHNFQWSEQDAATRGVRYVISGAGGSLRTGDVRQKMQAAHIAAWSPERHFLLVEIDGRAMTIHVLGAKPVTLRDKDGRQVPQPLRVTL